MDLINVTLTLILVFTFTPSIVYSILYVIYYTASIRGRAVKGLDDRKNGFSNKGLSIVIPFKNEPFEIIERTLSSIHKWGIKDKVEIILCSADDYQRYLEVKKIIDSWVDKGLNIVSIWLGKHSINKAYALNTALWVSRFDYVLVLDVDTVMPEDFLYDAIRIMDNDPNVVAVTARWRGFNRDSLLADVLYYATEFEVDTLYRGRRILNLPILALGTGTVYRTDFLKQSLKGWSVDNIVEDIDLGCKILCLGKRTEYLDKYVALIENPRRFSSLKTQQERWSYGSFYTFKKFFRKILASRLNPVAKVELLMYLNQYFPSISLFTGSILLATLSIVLRLDVLKIGLAFLASWFISLIVYSTCIAHRIYINERNLWRTLIYMGRLSVIHNLITPSLIKGFFKSLLGFKLQFKRTPKGSFEDRSLVRNKAELIVLSIFVSLTSVLLALGLIYTATLSSLFTLSYLHPVVKRWLD